jgi:hypothetical protein
MDYFSKAWIHDWPSSLRGKQLIFLPLFLLLATVAILVECLDCRTQFWKEVIKGLSKAGNPDIQPKWPLLLKAEKVEEILIVFLLNYWANHGFKLC